MEPADDDRGPARFSGGTSSDVEGSFLQRVAGGDKGLSPLLSSIMTYLTDEQVNLLAASRMIAKTMERAETNQVYWKERVENWFGVTLQNSQVDWKKLYEKLIVKYNDEGSRSFNNWERNVPGLKRAFFIVATSDDVDILNVILDGYRGRIAYEDLNELALESIRHSGQKVVNDLLDDPELLHDIGSGLGRLIDLAAIFGQYQAVKLILDTKEEIDPEFLDHALYAAIGKGYEDIIQLFLNDGRVNYGELSHHFRWAAHHNQLVGLKRLLEFPEVDPSIDNNIAIKYAVRRQNYDAARLLFNDPRVRNRLSRGEFDRYERLLGGG